MIAPKKETTRDNNIDMLRGAIMLYIVLLIHGLTTFHHLSVNSPLLSAMLFEMPVVFYLTGAANKQAEGKNLYHVLRSRFHRILIPYIVWCIFALAALFFIKDFTLVNLHTLTLFNGYSGIISIFVNHIWFIQPYFIISMFIPFLQRLYFSHWGGYKTICLILVLIFFIALFDKIQVSSLTLRNIFCYTIFVEIGFFYKDNNRKHFTIPLFSLSVCLLIVLLWSGSYSSIMQLNKFPPNLLFVLYGITIVCIINLVISKYIIPYVSILNRWNKYGMEIYLYQNFIFLFLSLYVIPSISGLNTFIQVFVVIITTFLMLSCISPLFYKINQYVNKRISI